MTFTNIGATGSLTIADAAATRSDALTVEGTDASNRFDVSATGDITLNTFTAGGTIDDLVKVHTPGVKYLGLEGFAGNNFFNIAGSIPFTSGILVDGGDFSGDTLNLTGPAGAIGVNVADPTTSTFTTITGYGPAGATIALLGVDVVNLTVGGNALTVKGTAGNDLFNFSPTAVGRHVPGHDHRRRRRDQPAVQLYRRGRHGHHAQRRRGRSRCARPFRHGRRRHISAVQSDATHFSFTLNAFTQPFLFAAASSVQGVNIAAGPGDDLIYIDVSDSLQTAPAGSLRFDVQGGPSGAERPADRQ